MIETDGNHYCDRCGVMLVKSNNKCGYEICDKCNEYLEKYIEKEKSEKRSREWGALLYE